MPRVIDTFTDTDGTAISSHAPDLDVIGGGWAQEVHRVTDSLNGTRTIQGNAFEISADGDSTGAFIDVGATDHFIEFDWIIGSGDSRIAVHLRRIDSSNSCYFNLREQVQDILLYKYVSGSQTQVGSTIGYAWLDNTTYRIRCEVQGTTYRLYVDGNLEHSGTITENATGTKVGLCAAAVTIPIRFDNVEAGPLGAIRNLTAGLLGGPCTGPI